MALSSLFVNNVAWAPTPASALTAPTPFHVPDLSMREGTEPVDPMDLCGGTFELSRDAASYVAQYYVDALSERMAVEAMASELVKDGLFALQSDHRDYVACVDTDSGWSRLLHRPVHSGSYLSKSRHIDLGAELVIAQRAAAK